MIKRFFDIVVSLILVIIFSPFLIIFSFLIWKQDWHSPFYVAPRVGKNEKIFKMIKFRSMIVNADKSGVDSTSANDSRITPLGNFIRKYKIDELPNFFNILLGERLEKIDKIISLSDSSTRNEIKLKIRSELNKGLDKENIFSNEDKVLIYKIYKKIQKEFEDLELNNTN